MPRASDLIVGCLVLASACQPDPAPSATPSVSIAGVQRREECLRCHAATSGIGAAHAPARVGCSPCHGGDPKARAKFSAHRGMAVSPGALQGVMSTCGQVGCHPAQAARVLQSPMARAAAIVAIDKFAFGERSAPEVRESDSLPALPENPRSNAEDHARKLCASCHLGQPKRERGDQGFFARGGGCTACHLGAPARSAEAAGMPHPAIDADVAERRCVGCHARSGRIALSYRGLAEVEPQHGTEQLPDGRPAVRTQSDVHARAGMTCIDCHSERDIMGDGSSHRHASEAVEVRCVDCHGAELRAQGRAPAAAEAAAALTRSWERRGLPSLAGRSPIVMARGTPLYRSDVDTRSLHLAASGQLRLLPALQAGPQHQLPGHERLSCQACHATWAPRCTECHTEQLSDSSAFDHLAQRETRGEWRERAGGNGFGPPALALAVSGEIAPFIEGMTLTVRGSDGAVRERALWAPLDPHTTGPARACTSCHPGSEGPRPTYPSAGATTRVGARLLDNEERARIVGVARCVPCHERYEDPIYRDFAASKQRLQARGANARNHLERRAEPRPTTP